MVMSTRWERALGLALGTALDAALGDPRRFHPVAGFGRAARSLERLIWKDSRIRGTLFTAVCVGSATAAAAAATPAAAGRTSLRVAHVAMTALATWAVLGARSLAVEGDAIADMLDGGDLTSARQRVTHLVSRDPSQLDEHEIARAAVESVAENASDAIVAPLLWGTFAGVPGLVGYRAVNTLDAMVGYRNARYRNFGWASARLDDIANYVPARVTALIVILLSGRPFEAGRLTAASASRHPSPNSGWPEASYAAALDLRLGGLNRYGDRVEQRPTLGVGEAPAPADIRRATAFTRRVTAWGAVVAAAVAWMRFSGTRRHGQGSDGPDSDLGAQAMKRRPRQ